MDTTTKKYDRFDWTLTLLLLLFFLTSCLAIYSAQKTGQYIGQNFLSRQIFWYIVGSGIIAVVMMFDSEQYRKLSWYLYGFGIFLLIFLFFAPASIAEERNGAKSWFFIEPLGSFQPSEFMKVFLILALSSAIYAHHQNHPSRTLQTDFLLFVKLGVITALPLGLILMQPDLGTSLVIIAIFTGIILVSGITWAIILPLYGSGAAIGASILYLVIWKPEILKEYLGVKTYQFGRIYAWLDPESYPEYGYHLLKSLSAIGSGMLTGKGINGSEVYIPESHTDFIFSVIGEEFGFIGGSFVISLYFLLIYHLTKTALDTNDPFNIYISTGVISMIAFHVFQNIGMTIQLLPITGIPLPFISYGGSSLMGNMMAMGLIYGIRFHHKTYMFASKDRSFGL
ncbi:MULTISPECIES: FtsW/RodA/SpoVE family cell cycle protein [Mesobacillus]|uniref:Cell cycle protein n=2 Tax=Mesobacillus TaxID=2675231 RepID=A0A0D6ZAN2_9BACI|nr:MULTISPECIES: FtsW/RodA/SpoVE family cell cycle protein [Mesobacillus]KIY22577.1 cell cycle protein [Mesobacillus subterraneus]MDQ0415023.1 rod shape determining protein RodA [Mesobacillus stamsii]